MVALVQPEQLREVQRLHAAANVEATVEKVHPDHPAVLDLGRSGEPIVIRPSVASPGGPAGAGRNASAAGPSALPDAGQGAGREPGRRGSQGRPQQRDRYGSR